MDTSSIAETIAESVEAHGQNWRIISGEVHLPPEECQIRFNKIVKEAKKSESQYMKQINGTGGGPPLSPPNDPLLEKVKTLIGPSLDGMYTMYDSDADFMKEQQELLPVTRQINPIELSVAAEVKGEPSIPKVTKRLNILKKRLDPALEDGATAGTSRKKKNVVESFVKLSECKNELVELQMKIAQEQHANQIAIQKMELEKMQTQMEFEKIKQEMEITFLKEKYALELSILKNKRNYIPQ